MPGRFRLHLATVPVVLHETEWLVDPKIAYLNHGGYGALPVPVARAAAALRAETEANPTDMLARQWRQRLADVRALVATLLHADDRDLVFVPNATAGTATILSTFPLRPGDEVVTTDHRYPAVAGQAARLAARGVRVVVAPVDVDLPTAADVVDAVMSRVTAATRLLVVDHIGSPTGVVFPVAAIVAAAHAAGVPVLVDAAHAPGQVDVDLAATDADFWVGNLHKWVCSPRACAVVRVAPPWHDVVRPLIASHGEGEGFAREWEWIGTLDPVPVLAVPAALEFWAALGWDDVCRHQHRLASDGARHVAAELGTRVPVPDEHTAAMRLVELPVALDADDSRSLGEQLTTGHGVTAAVTRHQGRSYVRVCGQLYNRPEHYDRLAVALQKELARLR